MARHILAAKDRIKVHSRHRVSPIVLRANKVTLRATMIGICCRDLQLITPMCEAGRNKRIRKCGS